MIEDLVKRLRAIDKDIILRRFDPEMSFDGMTAHKAADRIEKLGALVEQLREDNSSLIDSFDKDFLRQEARIEKLEAALRFYACDCKPDDGCGVEYYDGGAYCGYTARKALEGKND